jgi:DNA-binding beta-propeller fold protein YncE
VGDESPTSAAGFGVGSRVAGYRIEEELGHGGMAVVYLAHDARLDRRVALKVLAPGLARDQGFRQRFIRESRAAAAVDHPHIIPIFEAGEASGVLFIAMRLVRGGDVQTLIDTHGRLPAARVCHLLSQVSSALDAAHAYGLVHRDVKPANMLLDAAGDDEPGHVYLSDFGLSKRALGSTELTSAGQFLGTLNYVAPEQIAGRPIDGRTDLYALACSVYSMLCGTPPFKQDDSMAIMWAQLSTAPPPLTSRRRDLPAAVDTVMAKALAKAPADRYASCREFASALQRACGLDQAGPGPGRKATASRPPTEAVRPADLAAAAAPAGPVAGAPAPAGSGRAPATSPVPADAGARAAAADPATRYARAPAPGPVQDRPRRPGGTVHEGYPQPVGQPRSARRSRTIVVVAGVAVVGLAGGYFALSHGSGGGKPEHAAARVLAAPGCTARTAKAAPVAHIPDRLVTIGGRPFDVATAPGGYAFTSVGNGITVLRLSAAPPAILWTSQLPHAQGEAITPDRQYLAVADGSGIDLFRVQHLEQGPATPIGSLVSPGDKHAVEVALTPDGRFAFVTFQGTAHVGVFSLQRALRAGFGPADLVGTIPVGAQPVGVAVSADGRYAYVTSRVRGAPATAPGGVVNVIDVGKAEQHPASSVIQTVAAGCQPARVIPAPDGQHVWVSAAGANSLAAFSAAKLVSDPRHALVATVAVGSQPLGLAFVDHGTRILVADSNRDQPAGGSPDLAVVDPARVLAGQPGLLGYLSSGMTPRQLSLEPNGRRVLVTDTDSAQLQEISVTHLP